MSLYDQMHRLAAYVLQEGKLLEVNVWEEVYRLGPVHLSVATADDIEYPYVLHINHPNFENEGGFYF